MKVARRKYEMEARAEATAATGERILDAAITMFWEHPTDQIHLGDVARRAGVTVQTVIRRFGDKNGLFAAAGEREVKRVRDSRAPVTPGRLDEIVANLVAHYEELGDGVVRLLAEESRSQALARIARQGRLVHRAWCETAFGPFLDGMAAAERELRLAQFVALCDVYMWKLLRRDSGLSRAQTERAILGMLAALSRESTQWPRSSPIPRRRSGTSSP
ncbi:MAG: TetR/AcrR family transcriptional regulator [Alphaproteobacteria bacterium]